MRARTLRFGMLMAVTVGITLASAEVRAGEVEAASSSLSSVPLKYDHNQALPTSLQTGFVGPSFAKVNVGIKIEPVKDGGPLFSIAMPNGAQIEATWGTEKKIVLRAQSGSQTDGLITVRHTLTPSVDFKFDGFGLHKTVGFDATKLVNKLPGAKFQYDSQAQTQFAPWGFTPVETKLSSPDVSNSVLFSMDMNSLPDLVADNVTGTFGVRATTKPTFTYKTTKIMLSGVDGEITNTAGELAVPAVDGDFVELMAAVEGEMAVKGEISVQPFAHIDTILENDVSSDIDVEVFSVGYTTPATKVNFPTTVVHIPMPNVHVPAKGISMGNVKAGRAVTKKVEIENTGEKEAAVTFKSSDAQFQVESKVVKIAPKSSYELAVKFEGETSDPASAEIEVLSNDADSPVQTFKVGVNGADLGDEGDDLANGPSADGCGCKAAGTTPAPGWAGLGLIGLGAAVLFRRRKQAA